MIVTGLPIRLLLAVRLMLVVAGLPVLLLILSIGGIGCLTELSLLLM